MYKAKTRSCTKLTQKRTILCKGYGPHVRKIQHQNCGFSRAGVGQWCLLLLCRRHLPSSTVQADSSISPLDVCRPNQTHTMTLSFALMEIKSTYQVQLALPPSHICNPCSSRVRAAKGGLIREIFSRWPHTITQNNVLSTVLSIFCFRQVKLRIVPWHIFGDTGAKVKNFLRFSHLQCSR